MDRPLWEERMLRIAEQWSEYSTCKRRQVGAVIYDPATKAVLSIGYNDTPIGWVDCGDGGCKVCEGPRAASLMLSCNCIHSEDNAILLAARRGISVEGCFMAITDVPCSSCYKHAVQAGIEAVVVRTTVGTSATTRLSEMRNVEN